MAGRAGTLTLAFGGLAAAAVLALTLGTVGVVLWAAGGAPRLTAPDLAALRFTVIQAALSAGLSAGLAVPVARALARRQFRGRHALITLMGAPFILPSLVAIIGILSVFGRAGWISRALEAAGGGVLDIYGLGGILLAHVFFNLPLAVRMLVQGWADIPAERFRLAASLGFGPREVARFLERPMLRANLPGVALAVFLICLSSFAVALTLGGGPAATTVELAIYQAFRFDFDPARAAVLGAAQFGLCLAATVLAMRLAVPSGLGAGLDRRVDRRDAADAGRRLADTLLLGLTAAFLVLPLAAVAAAGLPWLADLGPTVWRAALRSVVMALVSAALTLALALALGNLAQRAGRRLARAAEITGMLTLAASPLVMGTGLFLALRNHADPVALALPVTVVVNAAMALPFALRVILPGLRETEAGFGRLADSLGLRGLARLRLLTLPRLRRPLGFAGGLAAALAMGDLGVIALFADPDRATLPLEVYRLMGAYRSNAAAAGAVVLVTLSFGLFWAFDRWGRRDADA